MLNNQLSLKELKKTKEGYELEALIEMFEKKVYLSAKTVVVGLIELIYRKCEELPKNIVIDKVEINFFSIFFL